MSILRLYFFPLLIIMLVSNYSNAQEIPGGLLEKLKNTLNDSTKVITLLEIGESIEATSPVKSFDYYQQALVLAKKINNNRCILSSMHDIGVCYIQLNKLDSAIVTFEMAIPVAKKLNDTLRIARLLGNIGNVYLHKKDPVKAIEYYIECTRLWETVADKNWLSVVYSNINSLLNDQKEYEKGIEYGNKAVALALKIGETHSVISALVNLSETYHYIGNFDKQYELLQQALPLAIKGKDIEQIAAVNKDLGDYYFQKKQFHSALSNYVESYNYYQQMGNKYAVSTSLSMLAQVYNKLNEKDKALQYIIQAEKAANEVGTRSDLRQIYLTRATIEQEAGNYKTAAEYFSKTLILTDSLFTSETSEKVADVEAKYQNEKKQLEILELEKNKKIQSLSIRQKSTLNYFLLASVGALMIVGFLGYRNLRHRHKLAKQQEELQQQRIRELEKDKQLVAVDSLLKGQEEERSRLAKDLHDGLGGLLSGVKFSISNMKDNLVMTPDNMTVFERSLDMIDTSIKELRRVAHNMMPEMLTKFGLDEAVKEYCNTINTTKLLAVKYQSLGMETRLDKSVEIIIYRIVQELLNNTMKHAAATEAFIQIIREGGRLNVVVEDNGKGFDIGSIENNKGAGLDNVRSRVDYLKGQLAINAEPGKGTLVNIEFNI